MDILRKIGRDTFDYQTLLDALSDYSKPRDRITRLLASGAIVRVKKGLYCFGETFRRGPVVREHLANLIYGPSYVSLDYALGYHGLIPERVERVTSVTTRRSREFVTPFGVFSYRMLSRYPLCRRGRHRGGRRDPLPDRHAGKGSGRQSLGRQALQRPPDLRLQGLPLRRSSHRRRRPPQS